MNRIDCSMDDMANTKFLTAYGSLIKHFSTSTDFNYNEVLGLLVVYYKFVKFNGPTAKKMTKKQFYELFLVLFRICDMSIIDRVLLCITNDVRFVRPEAWMQLFSVFLSKDTKIRSKFAYNVYTYSGTATLNREAVCLAVEKFFEGDDDDEVIELRADMVEFVFNKFDLDKDGIISYSEYAEVVQNQPPLIEFLGQVFPDDNDLALVALCTNIESKFRSDD
ncbi:calaxin-like [Drosophila tropicalis]|uniref:calaxin-like n=1 Tax=Drosophila tropicalis TaxID=46794 RepID=UPI0035AB8697